MVLWHSLLLQNFDNAIIYDISRNFSIQEPNYCAPIYKWMNRFFSPTSNKDPLKMAFIYSAIVPLRYSQSPLLGDLVQTIATICVLLGS